MSAVKTWQERFDSTLFARQGSSCFECCNYENMSRDMKSFIAELLEEQENRLNARLVGAKQEAREELSNKLVNMAREFGNNGWLAISLVDIENTLAEYKNESK